MAPKKKKRAPPPHKEIGNRSNKKRYSKDDNARNPQKERGASSMNKRKQRHASHDYNIINQSDRHVVQEPRRLPKSQEYDLELMSNQSKQQTINENETSKDSEDSDKEMEEEQEENSSSEEDSDDDDQSNESEKEDENEKKKRFIEEVEHQEERARKLRAEENERRKRENLSAFNAFNRVNALANQTDHMTITTAGGRLQNTNQLTHYQVNQRYRPGNMYSPTQHRNIGL